MTQHTSQALARKWRPKDFDSLVGQVHVVKALSHALDSGRLHHAYLFTGTRGVGKTTIARILAKAVNCERGISKTPCGVCNACVEIAQGRFVDLLEVDAATNTRVDEMRALLENAVYAPTAGRYKVYVIDEVHMLSNSAFNAMLKTLEEPPGHVLFILATTDPQKIPPTVLSRCLQFSLRQLPIDQLTGHLQHVLDLEGVSFEAAALNILAKAARGSMRDCLSLTDQAIAYSAGQLTEQSVREMLGAVDQSSVVAILQALAAGDGNRLVTLARELDEASAPFGALLDELASAAYRLSVAQFTAGLDTEDPDNLALQGLLNQFDPETLQLIYQIATHARAELVLAPSEAIGFSMALVRMLAFRPASSGGGQSLVTHKPVRPEPSVPKAVKAEQVATHTATHTATPTRAQTIAIEEAPRSVPSPAPSAISPSAIAPSAASASSDLPTPDQWPTLSQAVPVKGLTRQALVQTELAQARWEGSMMHLELITGIKSYTEPTMVSRLETALSQHLACSVKLQVRTGAVGQTAHAINHESRRQALEDAKGSLANDPFLNDIRNLMGANVVPGSERTLNQVGPADV